MTPERLTEIELAELRWRQELLAEIAAMQERLAQIAGALASMPTATIPIECCCDHVSLGDSTCLKRGEQACVPPWIASLLIARGQTTVTPPAGPGGL